MPGAQNFVPALFIAFRRFPSSWELITFVAMTHNDTIVALATPAGAGAIAVIRLSGRRFNFDGFGSMFTSVSGKVLKEQQTHTVHLGHVKDEERGDR